MREWTSIASIVTYRARVLDEEITRSTGQQCPEHWQDSRVTYGGDRLHVDEMASNRLFLRAKQSSQLTLVIPQKGEDPITPKETI